MTAARPQTMTCPNCNTRFAVTEQARWKPFCSERCKMVDLGSWLDGSYSVEAEAATNDSDQDGFLPSQE